MMEMKLVNHVRLFDGSLLVEPMSLSELDQEEFERFYSDALDFICREVMPNVDRSELEAACHELRARIKELEARDTAVKERVERFKGIEWE
jgi:hypothetical protein